MALPGWGKAQRGGSARRQDGPQVSLEISGQSANGFLSVEAPSPTLNGVCRGVPRRFGSYEGEGPRVFLSPPHRPAFFLPAFPRLRLLPRRSLLRAARS